jgi:hypothetical protein
MKRFRTWRRRAAALALAPVAVAMITSNGAGAAKGGNTALDASRNHVGPNGKVTLEGHFRVPQTTAGAVGGATPARGSQPIRIQFKALGAKSWQDQTRSKTGRKGGFSTKVEVKRSGRFRAVSSDGRTTPAELVEMQSRTSARLSDKNLKVGEKVKIRGHVVPGGTRRKLTVLVGGDKLHAKTRRNGTFSAKWKAKKVGSRTVRVRAGGNKVATGSGDKAGKVRVFRPAGASYYGPGLYGNGVACGGTLQPDTIGVANKTLPCGTKVTIRYKGKQAKAKVIDRGPYVAGREFDLTEALRNKLGFPGVGTIWVDK